MKFKKNLSGKKNDHILFDVILLAKKKLLLFRLLSKWLWSQIISLDVKTKNFDKQ